MTDMIERVARAVMLEIKRQLDGRQIPNTPNDTYWSAEGNMGSIDVEACVRVGIEAMREPTEAMVAAMGSDLTDEGEPRAGTQASLELARAHWCKGIDAALNHPSEPK